MAPIRVLYVSTGIDLFLQRPEEDPLAPLLSQVKNLCNFTVEQPNFETRLLIPRFGVIKERPNNIHETIRLSGINIPMGKDRISLVVKVPSVRGVKLPIYFVDNEELFQRKGVFTDPSGNFYPDNDVRILFFCKSVLAIVEKLGWIPHIIHCHGWMTAFIPLFIRKAFIDTNPLYHAKCVSTLYDDTFDDKFSPEMLKHARYKQLRSNEISEAIQENVGFKELTSLAIEQSHNVSRAFDTPQNPTAWEGINLKDTTYIPTDEQAPHQYKEIYEKLMA